MAAEGRRRAKNAMLSQWGIDDRDESEKEEAASRRTGDAASVSSVPARRSTVDVADAELADLEELTVTLDGGAERTSPAVPMTVEDMASLVDAALGLNSAVGSKASASVSSPHEGSLSRRGSSVVVPPMIDTELLGGAGTPVMLAPNSVSGSSAYVAVEDQRPTPPLGAILSFARVVLTSVVNAMAREAAELSEGGDTPESSALSSASVPLLTPQQPQSSADAASAFGGIVLREADCGADDAAALVDRLRRSLRRVQVAIPESFSASLARFEKTEEEEVATTALVVMLAWAAWHSAVQCPWERQLYTSLWLLAREVINAAQLHATVPSEVSAVPSANVALLLLLLVILFGSSLPSLALMRGVYQLCDTLRVVVRCRAWTCCRPTSAHRWLWQTGTQRRRRARSPTGAPS
jgi:hypothetical protein